MHAYRNPTSREDALALDAGDPLAPLRELFALPAGQIYLDGNSLGALPRATAAALQQAAERDWGQGLIRSWNAAGWIGLPARIGDQIARLVGAGPGELVAADSTSVNLYKVLWAALQTQRAADPRRTVIVSERSNFPTDLYIAQGLAAQFGTTLDLVDDADALPARLGPTTAVLLLTQVNYRTGRLHDMAALSAAARAAGALTIWDLAHSAGALPVDLHRDGADYAVGCGYKYLNGGPGAPAFVWAHPRHAAQLQQPLSGWMGHAQPFVFSPEYRPAEGIARYLCGTPPVLAMLALECGVATLLAAEPLGGMAALRAKSLALTRAFADGVHQRCAGLGLRSVTPLADAQRGSQVSLAFEPGPDAPDGYAVMQALIARGVVGDFRAGDPRRPEAEPDLLRFGFTPLYTRFVDAWDAVTHLHAVLAQAEWRRPEHLRRQAVT